MKKVKKVKTQQRKPGENWREIAVKEQAAVCTLG
jgi:hypothetical protein